MSDANKLNSIVKLVIILLVLIIGYFLFFGNDKAEKPKDDPALISEPINKLETEKEISKSAKESDVINEIPIKTEEPEEPEATNNTPEDAGESEAKNETSEEADKSNSVISGNTAEKIKNLDIPALLKLKRTIKNSSVFVSIDKKGNQTLLGNDLEPGERCIPNAGIKNYKPSEKRKRCAAFNKDSELLSIENSSLLTSKGSYIFTYFVNGASHQICYNDDWVRITCP